ncbi:MAG TPA: hypothetical protein PKA27_02270 [Fimbriimonadaceae bacterium]|nr:hypothetical protein [Fimbriimonadaceae bacterium]
MGSLHSEAKAGGYSFVADEALPSNAVAANLFFTSAATFGGSLPDGLWRIQFTVRTATLTIRFGNGTPTAGANGHDYAAGGPYELVGGRDMLSKIKGIGGATGWITYHKV